MFKVKGKLAKRVKTDSGITYGSDNDILVKTIFRVYI